MPDPFLLATCATSCLSAALAWHMRKAGNVYSTLESANAALRSDRQVDLFRLSRRDSLTGLSNRAAFLETLSSQLVRGPLALLLIDLDRFDAVNANLGEAGGNELLAAFAGRLRALVTERDHAARVGSDSFALLITRPDELELLPRTVAQVFAALSIPNPASGELVDTALSMGVARAPGNGRSAETLMRAARVSLTHAKSLGGGRFHLCGEREAADILDREQMRAELQRAIEAGQVVPYYQPVVSLPSGQIAKFEVLARWNHPKNGLLLAEHFIPLADEMGLSGQISTALLRHVAHDTREWPAWCRFAVNVSAGQVRELIGLLRTQPGTWQRRMDMSRLDVEISETALMADRALVRELIDVLHEHGARAVLDDFGSGASNFLHLRDLPFDSIKIGKVFVQRLAVDPRAEACVTAMLLLGKGLGIDIVADGVETEDVAERLGQLGCHFAQGFLYARPAPAAAAAALLGIEPNVAALVAA